MKFFIKSKKAEGKSNLFFEVNKRVPKFKAQFNTYISVDVQHWQKVNADALAMQKYCTSAEGAKVMSKLQQIEDAVSNLFTSHQVKSTDDKALIADAVRQITFADEIKREKAVEAEKAEALARIKADEENKYNVILNYCKDFTEGVESGAILNNGKPYTKNTISQYKNLYKILIDFLKDREYMTFDDISKSTCNQLVNFLRGRGYMESSVKAIVGVMKSLCNKSAEDGYNKNASSLKCWKVSSADKEQKKYAVYLTDYELQKLYEMPLVGTDAKVRDAFFVGAMTSQRFSDYSRLKKDMFRVIDGITFLYLKQRKTGKDVIVPITDERVLATLARNNYNISVPILCRFNKVLKRIFSALSLRVPTLKEQFETMPTKYDVLTDADKPKTKKAINADGKKIVEKWQLVSSHTARRSGVTNMYKHGLLDVEEMKSISGHSSDGIFENYIKLGTLEKAKRIAEKLSTGKAQKVNANVS